MLELATLRVGTLPTIAYVPDYLTPAEEASLLREICGAKRWTEVRCLRRHSSSHSFQRCVTR